MKSKTTQLWLIASLALLPVLFTACKKHHDDDDHGHHYKAKVRIENFSFTPSTLTVSEGVTVVWTNYDTAPHTVTADDDSFDSGTLNTGDSYSHTFHTAGTFSYHCEFHPMMVASVVVNE